MLFMKPFHQLTAGDRGTRRQCGAGGCNADPQKAGGSTERTLAAKMDMVWPAFLYVAWHRVIDQLGSDAMGQSTVLLYIYIFKRWVLVVLKMK